MKKLIAILTISWLCFLQQAHAGDCGPTQVKEISPHKDGGVWFKFTNGTQFAGKIETDVGLKHVLSVALAARAMNANVLISLGDDTQCGTGGNATSWLYLKLIN